MKWPTVLPPAVSIYPIFLIVFIILFLFIYLFVLVPVYPCRGHQRNSA